MARERNDLAVGVFEHRSQAERAVLDLWSAGFAHDRIDMLTRDGNNPGTPNLHLQDSAGNSAVTGAAAGAGLGAVAGAIAVTLVPGIGTIIGGGLLAGLLGGAAFGAAGGAFLGPFIALEMNEDDAHYYAHAVDEGHTVVFVHAPGRLAEAKAILQHAGAQERQPAAV